MIYVSVVVLTFGNAILIRRLTKNEHYIVCTIKPVSYITELITCFYQPMKSRKFQYYNIRICIRM